MALNPTERKALYFKLRREEEAEKLKQATQKSSFALNPTERKALYFKLRREEEAEKLKQATQKSSFVPLPQPTQKTSVQTAVKPVMLPIPSYAAGSGVKSAVQNIQDTQNKINQLQNVNKQLGSMGNPMLPTAANYPRNSTSNTNVLGLKNTFDKKNMFDYLGEKFAGGAASFASGAVNYVNDLGTQYSKGKAAMNMDENGMTYARDADSIANFSDNLAAYKLEADKGREIVRNSPAAKGLSDYNAGVDERYNNPTGIYKLGGDISNVIGEQIIPFTLNLLSGGAASGAYNVLSMAMSAAGNAASEARAEGATEDQSMLYGALSGGLEGALEGLSGGAPWLTKTSLLGKVTKNALKKNITSAAGQAAIAQIRDIIGEGWEEYVGEVAGAYLKKLYNNDTRGTLQTFIETQPDAFYAGLLGALTSGFMNAPSSVKNISNGIKSNKAGASLQQSGQLGDVVSKGLDSTDADIKTVAQRMAQTMTEGGKIKNSAVGDLYNSFVQSGDIAGLPLFKRNDSPQSVSNAANLTQDIEKTAQNVSNTEQTEPLKVGQATKIYKPYTGQKPTERQNAVYNKVDIAQETMDTSNNVLQQAGTNKDGSARSFIRKAYTGIAGKLFSGREVNVKNTIFNNEDYNVTLNKSVIKKVVSDKNLSAEKMAVLENIDNVVSNSKYVGSGEYNKNNLGNEVVRYDYFETDAIIGNKPYIISFDVEVRPEANQYRTHKVIKEMNLISRQGADMVQYHTPLEKTSSSNNNIPPQSYNVNNAGTSTQNNVVLPPMPQNKTASKAIPLPMPTASQQNKVRNLDALKTNADKSSPLAMENASASISGSPQDGKGVSGKAQRVQSRNENDFVNTVGEALSVPKGARREFLRPIAQEMSNEIKQSGKVSEDTAQKLFDMAWKQGIVEDTQFYDTYKDLKQNLREVTLTLDRDSANSREYEDMRRRYFGTLNILNHGGTPVDIKYMELSETYPELFDAEITAPLDQLDRIGEVAKSIQTVASTLDSYYGEYLDDFRRYARVDFDKAINKLHESILGVKRYEDDVRAQAEQKAQKADVPQVDYATVKKAYETAHTLSLKADKIVANTLLTDADKKTVEKLLRGDIDPADVKSANKAGIMNVYNARKASADALAPVKAYNAARRAALHTRAEELTTNSDAWKGNIHTLSYDTSTLERNIRNTIKDSAEAESVIKEYATPVHAHEAEANRFKNEQRAKIKQLRLNPDESVYLQMYGELKGVEAAEKMGLARNAGEREQLQKLTDEYLKQHGDKINLVKIDNAITIFKTSYDAIFEKMNEAYISNGYAPINYRSGYFPHFQEGEPDTFIKKIAKASGLDIQDNNLPTDIVGRTYAFKPGRRWNKHALKRTGTATTYDAVQGFDRYIEIASDVIYHTEDIQKLRAFEDTIRARNSKEGYKEALNEIYSNDTKTDAERENALEELRGKSIGHLGNFVMTVNEYTNLLAGKKSVYDRGIERALGRKIFTIMGNVERRVGSNMVVGNLGSALTNIIPMTQMLAECSTGSILKASRDTVKAFYKNDGFVDSSTFLTNRRGSSAISQTWSQKLADTLMVPMSVIDDISSNVITRAKYYENLKRGMSANEAIEQAGEYASALMADRSKGSMPNVFSVKNPIVKAFSMFQLEVNNQFQYMFKDLPANLKDKGVIALAAAYLKMFLAAYLFDDLFEKLTGRRSAFDPVDLINETVGNASGYALPNTVDAIAGAASGKGVDFTTNKKSVTDTVMGAAKNVAEELPFVGGWLGGGRLPINSAIPDFGVLGENTIGLISGEKNKDKALANIGKEIGKPLAYLAPSYGGGQIKKTLEGLDTIHNGGDYNIDKNGNEQQKFAVEEKTPLKTLQAATFGKWSLPEAREYIEGGTKLKSVQYTTAYRQAIDSGMSGDNFRSVWANMDADNNGKIAMGEAGNALMNTSGITDAQRATLWKNIASDTQLSKYNTAEEKGLGDEYAIAYMSADTNGNNRITQTEAEAYLKQAIKDRAVQKLMYSLLVGEDSNPFK